jgi:pimeloyl-ACP methyl ester carboxylesterase
LTIVTVNGLTTHYQRVDAAPESAVGETVVFVHGLGTDSLASFHLTLATPVAAAGYDVLTYDLRGHGRTERPPVGYSLDHFVADLDELLDQLGLPRVHLVGNSFGGTVAFSYAAAHPDRVASIVAIEAEPASEPWSGRMTEVLDKATELFASEETFTSIEAQFGAHHRRLARLAAERFNATSMPQEIPRGPVLDADQLGRITCPVLSLLGSDGFQADDPHFVSSLLPRTEVKVFAEQGHSVLVERHREVRGLLLDWLRRVREESPGLPAGMPAGTEGPAWRAS